MEENFVKNKERDEAVENKKNFSAKNQAWWQPAIFIFLRTSGWIVFPLIFALFIGGWLDKKYDTSPWLVFGSVGIAFLATMVGLIKTYKREIKKIDKFNKYDK